MLRLALLSGLVFFVPHAAFRTPHWPHAAAQDDAKKVKLRWFGQSMFQLETAGGKSVVFDPQMIPTFGPPRLSADVTLVSHPHSDHNQVELLKEKGRVFEGVKAGKGARTEWVAVDEKVGAIRVRSVGTFHDPLNGTQRGKNSVWVVEADGLTFAHLGDLGHELTEAQVKAIGKVDVLMVPVGGIYTLNGEQAKKVVEQIKPRLFVLPMHYAVPGFDELQPATEFLEEQKNVKKLPDTNELEIPVDLKADGPTVVVLGWKAPARPDPVPDPKKGPEKQP